MKLSAVKEDFFKFEP